MKTGACSVKLACPGVRPAGARMAALAGLLACATAQADWPTYRGSAQRTGCLDDQAGPETPAILWAHKSQGNYIAAPLPEGTAVYFPALGVFNSPLFQCLAAPENLPRLLWSKNRPFLRRPVVCAPVISEGLLIFGDGMHQTDDAALYCLMANTGRPVWQYPVPGKLVHIEASPTVENGRVYVGAGAAGVLCLDMKRVVLEGQEMDLAASQAVIEQRWKDLKGAGAMDYSPAPGDDALPKPAPKLIWQSGKESLHVDAPVTVAGKSVLAGSAFLDEEKAGKRALLCLRADDGGTAWETPLTVNPWAGATVAGQLALVGCSSIRFDADLIRKAAGEVVAVELASGRVAWRKPVPGGILSPIAVKDGLAVFTATDGKVRAWKADSGDEQWIYDAGKPFFAGPAVAAGVVYAADLAGVLHALKLADGGTQWIFDAANAAGAQLPGMVYGSPVLYRGRIYLATCNIQGSHAGEPCMVACIADKQAPSPSALLTIDAQNRTVTIPCRVAPRKLPTLADIYPLEVVACFPAPLGQKAHETVVATEVKPSDLHAALVELGLNPGAPSMGVQGRPSGPEVRVLLELPDIAGRPRLVPIEDTMLDARTGRGILPLKWHFTGSSRTRETEGSSPNGYPADLGGTLITLFPVTGETVVQSTLSMKTRALLNLDTDKGLMPPEGTPVRLIIAAGAPPPGVRPLPQRRATGGEPSPDPLRASALAKPVELRQAPSPFVRMPIPEPSETAALVQLDAPPPDNDAPVRPVIPAGRIELPAGK